MPIDGPLKSDHAHMHRIFPEERPEGELQSLTTFTIGISELQETSLQAELSKSCYHDVDSGHDLH